MLAGSGKWRGRANMKKTIVVAALLGAVITIGGCKPKTEENADSRFQGLYAAEWKWREHCRRAERERKRAQWGSRGGAARLKRRRQRKERKQAREVAQMRNLRLDPAPNQILPGTPSASQMK